MAIRHAGTKGQGRQSLTPSCRNRKHAITNDRIEHERGVLRKSIRKMDMWRVHGLAYEQTLVESIFGLGQVVVVSSDNDTARVEIGPLRHSKQLYDKLKRVHVEAGRRPGR